MMWGFLKDEPVILASDSPRRIEILTNTGLTFRRKPSGIDESIDPEFPLERGLIEVSRHKVEAASSGEKNGWIIGADTVVAIGEKVLGKPSNHEEATEMLRMLSGRTHRVITAYTILRLPVKNMVSDFEVTQVTFYPLSEEEIGNYISTGEPFDKAGAYGAQGRGNLLIKRIEGCFFNVVGLPLSKLRRTWMEFIREESNG